MRVAKWKVLSVAGALVLGYAASAKAVKVAKVGEDQFLNLGVRVKAWYLSQEAMFTGTSDTKSITRNTYVWVDGQINEYIEFAADIAPVGDASITFGYIPQTKITIGQTTVPFARYKLAGTTTAIIPVHTGISDPAEVNITIPLVGTITINPMDGDDFVPGSEGLVKVNVDPIGNGMLKIQGALFPANNQDLSYALRVDVAPVNMGFAPAGAYGHSYLGKKDVLNIGGGYVSLKNAILDANGNRQNVTGITFDVMFEKNVAPIVPNIQVGYISLDKTHLDAGQLRGSSILYAQGQVLYDQVVGIGKPAIAFQYDSLVDDNTSRADDKLTRFGIAFNYYIKGHSAKLSVGLNNFNYEVQGVPALQDFKEFYIFAQVKF